MNVENSNSNVEELSLLMDFEVVNPIFVKDGFKAKPSLMRFNYKYNRFYATYNFDNNNFELLKGVTTHLHNIIIESDEFRDSFIARHGASAWKIFLNEKAKFGTFVHNEINYYLNNKMYDLELGKLRLRAWYDSSNFIFLRWFEVNKDFESVILGFIAFCIEYNVEPIMIEYAGAYIDNEKGVRFAGAIDLFCYITTKEKGFWGEVYKSGANKGQPKETYKETTKLAIVDFKSGTAQMNSHKYQLKMYEMIIRQNYNIDAEILLLNVYRKDFKNTEPSPTVSDRTNKVPQDVIEKLISAHSIMNNDVPTEFRVFDDVITAETLYSAGKVINATDYLMQFDKSKNYIEYLKSFNN
jgi:hypothetical protein